MKRDQSQAIAAARYLLKEIRFEADRVNVRAEILEHRVEALVKNVWDERKQLEEFLHAIQVLRDCMDDLVVAAGYVNTVRELAQ